MVDVICDLVSIGSILFKNGLEEKDIIFKLEVCIVKFKKMFVFVELILNKLIYRIKFVLIVRNNKYLLMNVLNDFIK